MAGVCIVLKQSTGLIIAVIVAGNLIVQVRGKKDWKEFWKIAGVRIAGILLPVISVIGYIVLKGAFSHFMDYCFLGIKTFSNKITYSTLYYDKGITKFSSRLIPIIFALLLFYYLRNVWKQIKTKQREKKDFVPFLLLAYGIAEFSVVFPISDKIHFWIGSTIGILGFFYISIEILKKILSYLANKISERKRNFIRRYMEYFIEAATILMMLYFLGKTGKQVVEYIKTAEDYQQFEHYQYVPILEGLSNRVQEVNNWILSQEKDVYILDSEGVLYQIPLNRYHKDYDMFLKGNLGGRGEEGQIENLKKEENVLVLLKKEEYSRNWQNPELVRRFIIENYEKTDSISIFDSYDLSRKK